MWYYIIRVLSACACVEGGVWEWDYKETIILGSLMLHRAHVRAAPYMWLFPIAIEQSSATR